MCSSKQPRDVGDLPAPLLYISRPAESQAWKLLWYHERFERLILPLNPSRFPASKPYHLTRNMADSEKITSAPEAQFKGSCACGRITYTCSSPPKDGSTTACHCVTCRKLSGGPFQAFAHVESKSLTYFDKQAHLRHEGLPRDNMGGIVYLRLSPVGERAFCKSCNTPLAMRYKHEPENVGVALGSIDEDSISNSSVRDMLQLDQHIFTSQKAFWVGIEKDGVPKFERFTGGFEEDMAALGKQL